MTRRLLLAALAGTAGCRVTRVPPAAVPPKERTTDRTVVRLQDGRTTFDDEPWYPADDIVDRVSRVIPEVAVPPAVVTVRVSSYRQSVKTADRTDGGGYQSVIGSPDAIGSNWGSSPDGAIFAVGLLGILELLNLGWFVAKQVPSAAPPPAADEEPGAICRLKAAVEIEWPGGKRTAFDLDVRGTADRGADEKKWAPAVQRSRDALAAEVGKAVWAAVRDGPP